MDPKFHTVWDTLMYWESLGGQSLFTSLRDDVLDIVCYAIGLSDRELYRTRREFIDKLDRFSALDYLNLRSTLREGTFPPAQYFRFCMEMLRLSQWDPETLYELSESLVSCSESLNSKEKRELTLALDKVWENYFPIGEARDVPFEIARILFRMEYYDRSQQFYQESLRLFGRHKMTHHNIGMCLYYLRRLEQAKKSFEESLELDPAYGATREWLLRLEPEIRESEELSL